ncbi:G protein-coupled receptor rhodopsin-like [Trinorchestia longiramus]|nr:G protein-coupled receptor rhodopsin-like [Trinorchestia longiramus]
MFAKVRTSNLQHKEDSMLATVKGHSPAVSVELEVPAISQRETSFQASTAYVILMSLRSRCRERGQRANYVTCFPYTIFLDVSWRRARQLVAAAWLLSAVFAAPSLWLFREAEVQGMKQCWISFPEPWHWQLYMVLVALTLFVIPCLLISLCYIVIVHTIWSKSQLMLPRNPGNSGDEKKKKNGAAATATAAVDEDCRRASSRGLIPKAKVKTVKMTLVIVVVFILCWSPYIVFDLLQVFGLAPNNQALATLMQSLAPLNSAANPVIYCWFSTRLCRNLRYRYSSGNSSV